MFPILLSERAIDGLAALRKENPKLVAKFVDLVLDIFKHPNTGLGKPEPLKHEFEGWWSRRISQKHRLVYRIDDENLEIASCHGHYSDK